jgi:hypothetical protein
MDFLVLYAVVVDSRKFLYLPRSNHFDCALIVAYRSKSALTDHHDTQHARVQERGVNVLK